MKKVFKKLAVPPASDPIIELIKINRAPVTREDIPENTFLSKSATDTEDPTAAQYPCARSVVVYLDEAFLLP